MEKKSQISSKGESNEFGFIPKSQMRGSDADFDRQGKSTIESFKNIGKGANDEELKGQSLFRKRRNTWNSVNFENEDFLTGFTIA
ncbi:hypothetical protein [Nubsella zeaxanthinifaciens]|uniref:hypothetical protein n=1 Tax=Nubsella zeaxanthinifaciens TaxID=392412 RepID=UPI000DE3192B|nr:hypothetical protein [Nubsella zeaxanthinifaciens]